MRVTTPPALRGSETTQTYRRPTTTAAGQCGTRIESTTRFVLGSMRSSVSAERSPRPLSAQTAPAPTAIAEASRATANPGGNGSGLGVDTADDAWAVGDDHAAAALVPAADARHPTWLDRLWSRKPEFTTPVGLGHSARDGRWGSVRALVGGCRFGLLLTRPHSNLRDHPCQSADDVL